ncbi:MAG: hypothetical protein JNN07_09075 [Verrucomicrobiales bacterium]|nr:hypothetical protein [Verrucomicrobiales bacterium]
MGQLQQIQIVGGGLAGLSLGIGLRLRGIPVFVWESGRYPRHRVCGEFIDGLGLGTLVRFGLLGKLREGGARDSVTVATSWGRKLAMAPLLAQPALSISRFTLDEVLSREFQRLGGELGSGQRWVGEYGPGIVRACGRRVESTADGWRLFGLKAHARNVSLEADLEMHFVGAGYVGLSRLSDGQVNVCGLFRTKTPVAGLSFGWREWLRGPAGSLLYSRLVKAQFDDSSFCSVAGLGLRPQRATRRLECCVGDALTMIPPLTGNGMSMAFESAELAVQPLERFGRGELSWAEAQRQVALACDLRFESRLRWAACIQWALFQPLARGMLLSAATRSPWLWRTMHGRTR